MERDESPSQKMNGHWYRRASHWVVMKWNEELLLKWPAHRVTNNKRDNLCIRIRIPDKKEHYNTFLYRISNE